MSRPAWRTDRTTAGRGYDTRWQKASKGFLRKHPLCKLCADISITTAATLVDHIIPHRGDLKLFWKRSNWQPCCDKCHNTVKKRQENTGILIGCDADGMPVDPNHPWNLSNVSPTEADRTEDRSG